MSEFNARARTRRGLPETSLQAAASLEDLTARQDAVLALLRREGPLTDADIEARYPESSPAQSPSGLRSRRAELVMRGLIRDTQRRARLASGRAAVVWEATPLPGGTHETPTPELAREPDPLFDAPRDRGRGPYDPED